MGLLDFLKKDSKKLSRYDMFLTDCEKTIISYENDSQPSCKEDLMNAIKEMTHDATSSINKGELPPSRYGEFIHKLLSNCTFDLLASGKYHLYRGMLNPMSCASNLMMVHNKSLEFALQNNMITQKEIEDDSEYLRECIHQVG